MKKLLLTMLATVLITGTSFSYTIYWYSGDFYRVGFPSSVVIPPPDITDGTNALTVGDLSCNIVSDAIVNSLLMENGGNLTISNSATLAILENSVIDAGTIINVQAGATLILNKNISNNGTINVLVGGNLIQSSGTNSGSGVYNISATGTGSTTSYNTWSSPVSGVGITSVFGSSNHCDIYHFNASAKNG